VVQGARGEPRVQADLEGGGLGCRLEKSGDVYKGEMTNSFIKELASPSI